MLFLLCLLSVYFSTVYGVVVSSGNASATILGQSGKVTFDYAGMSVQLTMSSVTEVDSDGEEVGNTGGNSGAHSFNSFASQDFTFSNIVDTTYQGVPVANVNFSCPLIDGTSNLLVNIYLFTADGTIENNGTDYNVGIGSFKFSYYIDNWPFCTIGGTGPTLCMKGGQEQEGSYLDFEVIMKGSTSGSVTQVVDNITTTITFGDESNVAMPVSYQIINMTEGFDQWYSMPANYPVVDAQGSKDTITFRFSRWENAEMYYDPIVTFNTSASITNSGQSNISGGFSTAVTLTMVIMFVIGMAVEVIA
eukprot:TRINITY_DN52264_c0_g1_i1.p1 TRINITY_DN52264_c0_g1~~TRINITY_DN52264_c0_g1_i1.p1  ORF type:complete len:305 (-),score=-5.39 TRINITY_DN52264_c0_g1_i1:225-1139(-)